MTIGEVIAEIRDELGFSQEQLANLASVTKSTVWKIENGQSPGTRTTLDKIAKALRTTVPELYQRAGLTRAVQEQAYNRDPLVTRLEIALESVDEAHRDMLVEVFEHFVRVFNAR